MAAVTVLVLGGLVLFATAVSVALGHWETTTWKLVVLLVVLAGMWRSLSHLRVASHAR